jgi:hypothetical protein
LSERRQQLLTAEAQLSSLLAAVTSFTASSAEPSMEEVARHNAYRTEHTRLQRTRLLVERQIMQLQQKQPPSRPA